MADASKLFALMGCRGANISGMPRGGGPSLTAEDVAGALGMGNLDNGAYLIGRAKWLDDREAAEALKCAIVELFKFKYKVNSEQAHGLALLSLFDVLWFKTCPTCKGGCKTIGEQLRFVLCERCNGTGVVNLSERKQAKIANVPHSTWQRNLKYSSMVNDARRQLMNLEQIASRHIKTYIK